MRQQKKFMIVVYLTVPCFLSLLLTFFLFLWRVFYILLPPMPFIHYLQVLDKDL